MLRFASRVHKASTRSFTTQWKQQRDADIYANRAIKEGMRSRAAYKLDEINKRFGNFLRQGAIVIDLGASPGGFSVVASKHIHLKDITHDTWNSVEDMDSHFVPADIARSVGGVQMRRRFGQLICVDKQDMDPVPGAVFVRGDMNTDTTYQKILYALNGKEADVVISDMAPSTTGQKEQDHFQIMQLAEEALHVADRVLRNGGTFCCKIFSGCDEVDFRKDLESSFLKVKGFKPAASRKGSKELYYIAKGFVPAHLTTELSDVKQDDHGE